MTTRTSTTLLSALGGLGLLLCMLAPTAALHAQSDCVPVAGGVPALGGPPNWYDSAVGEPDYWPRLDDPRWRGSFLRTFGGMVGSEHLRFRALRHGAVGSEVLFLSWYIRADPSLDNNADSLFVAFSPGGAAPDVLINVEPFAFNNADIEAADPFSAVLTLRDPMTNLFDLGNPEPPPTWFANTKIWLETVGNEWAIQMRIPIAALPAGLDLQPSFRLWFTAQVVHPAGVVFYDYPDFDYWDARSDPDPASRLLTLTDILNGTDSTDWAELRRDVAPTHASCLQGISLVASDVGVASAANCANPAFTLSSSIDLIDAGSPATNTFCARPLNETGGAVGAGDVTARFRIANWGTEPDWNDVTDPLNTLWSEINCVPAVASGPAIPNAAKGALTCDWPLTVPEVCAFDPTFAGCPAGSIATRRIHQCMLVELDAIAGTALSVSSVYRNMNFVDASVFRRECTVATVRGQERDVFLYVQTTNMPRQVEAPQRPPDPKPRRPPGIAGRDDDGSPGDDRPGRDEIPPLEEPFYGQLRGTMPTYVVHNYYDTGTTTTVAGAVRRVLRPQTSFGYFVRHEGDLDGWRHSLTGAREIAPDYYEIAVPDGATRTVTTTIEAIETGRFSLSLHAGFNQPQARLSNATDGSVSLGLDLEYAFDERLALELFLGYDQFDGKAGTADLDVTHLAVDLRWYFTGGAVARPFVLGGVGYYDLDPGGSGPGLLFGAGAQFPLSGRTDLEIEARYHTADASPDIEWVALHGGLRVRF